MLRAAGRALVGAWRRIVRLPRRGDDSASRERQYLGGRAAAKAERARQALEDHHRDISGNMGAGGFGGPG